MSWILRIVTLPLCLFWHDDECTGDGYHSGDLLRWEYRKCRRCGRKTTVTLSN